MKYQYSKKQYLNVLNSGIKNLSKLYQPLNSGKKKPTEGFGTAEMFFSALR